MSRSSGARPLPLDRPSPVARRGAGGRDAPSRARDWRIVDAAPGIAVAVDLVDLGLPGHPRFADLRDEAMMDALEHPSTAALELHDEAAEACWEAETRVRRFASGVGQWPEAIGLVGPGPGDRWPPVLAFGPYLRLVDERLVAALRGAGLSAGWNAISVPLWDGSGRLVSRFQALSVTGRVAGGAAAAVHDPHRARPPRAADVWVDPSIGRRGPMPALALIVDPRWPELVPALVAGPWAAETLRRTGVLGLDLQAVREDGVSVPAPSAAPAAARARRRR